MNYEILTIMYQINSGLTIRLQIVRGFFSDHQQNIYKNFLIFIQSNLEKVKDNTFDEYFNQFQQIDQYLKFIVSQKQKHDWHQVARLFNEKFPQKQTTFQQCKKRYVNYLRKSKESSQVHEWSKEEFQKLLELFEKWGPKWTKISQNIQGRTQNQVKNKFYCSLRKIVRKINIISKNNHRKIKKQLKYESVFRILNEAELFTTLTQKLRLKLVQIRRKIINLAKIGLSDITNEQIITIIDEINSFNLSTRSYRCQKHKRPQIDKVEQQNKLTAEFKQIQVKQEGAQKNLNEHYNYAKNQNNEEQVQGLDLNLQVLGSQLKQNLLQTLKSQNIRVQSDEKWKLRSLIDNQIIQPNYNCALNGSQEDIALYLLQNKDESPLDARYLI